MNKSILAVDVGYGNTKLVFGRDGNYWNDLVFKSLAPTDKSGGAGRPATISDALDRITVPIGAEHYIVGPDAIIAGGDAILSTNFIEQAQYMALMRGAIYYSMKNSGEMKRHIDVLVLGLPVSNWRRRQAELIRIAEGPHPIPVPIEFRAEFGEQLAVSIGKVIVLPQPMGALRYALMNVPKRELNLDTSIHMVIDIGYGTLDWFVSSGLRPELQRSGSLKGGVSQLLKHVANVAGDKLGIGTLNVNEVEKGLAEGVMRADGVELQMAQFAHIMESEAERVVHRFVNAIDMELSVKTIHLVGGGAPYYLNALRKVFRSHQISIDSDTVVANVRGFYLYGEAIASTL